MNKLKERLLSKGFLTLAATIAACFSLVLSVSAQVPPASRPFKSATVAECKVGGSIAAPSSVFRVGNTGSSGDVVLVTLNVARYQAAASGNNKINVAIQQLPQGRFMAGSIHSTSIPGQMEVLESTENILRLRTVNPVNQGQSLTTVLAYKLKDNATLTQQERINFFAYIAEVNADGSLNSGCITDEVTTVTIGPAIQFDTSARLRTSSGLVHPGQTIKLTGNALNELASRDAIPGNVGFQLEMTYPTSLQYQANPDNTAPYSPPTTTTAIWRTSTGGGLDKGKSFPASWQVDLKKPDGAPFVQNHVVQFCIIGIPGSTGNWVRQHEKDGGIKAGNNCTTLTLHDSPISISKTWTDDSTTRRVFEPNGNIEFKIKVTNHSPSIVGGIVLNDTLQRAETCNNTNGQPCPEWDATASWVSTNPTGTINGNSIQWNVNPLGSGQSSTFLATAKAASEIDLVNIMSNNNAQNRCNRASADLTIDGEVFKEASYICFNYGIVPPPEEFQVSKTVSSAQIKQGAKAQYTISGTNTSIKYPVIGTSLYDVQTDQFELVRWESANDLAAKNLKQDTNNEHVLRSVNQFNVAPNGGKAEFKPNFYVLCDAFDRRSTTTINNKARFTDQTGGIDKWTETAPFAITNGHYNLTAEINGDPQSVVPNDPLKNKVAVTIKLKNTNPSRRVDVAVPDITWTTDIPSAYTLDVNSISDAGATVSGNKITWSKVGNLGVNATKEVRFSATIKDNTLRRTPLPAFTVSGASASAGENCGRFSKSWSPEIIAPQLVATKKVEAPTNSIANPGDRVTFSLNIRNMSGEADMNRTNTADHLIVTDPIGDGMSYVGAATCNFIPASGAPAACEAVSGPSESGKTISWRVGKIPKNTTVSLKFDTVIDANVVASACPTPLYNSSPSNPAKVVDPNDTDASYIFGPAVINIYPEQCLQGNIYAKGVEAVTNKGINITSDSLVIDSNTVLSAKGSIECNINQSCIDSAYKFGSYDVGAGTGSVGLDLNAIIGRMRSNINRVLKNAELLTAALNSTGNTIEPSSSIVNIYKDKLTTDYPEGRTIKVAGDLTLDAKGGTINFKGKGTFIVCGNLNITDTTGTGGVQTDTDTAKSGIGFIVLPRTDCPFTEGVGTGGGSVTIGGKLTKLSGIAIYAPGTNGTTLDSNSSSGVITFAAADDAKRRLQPAEGLFIAREFSINRQAAVFRYRKSLNTPEGAPPGFSFASSPNDTNEGR